MKEYNHETLPYQVAMRPVGRDRVKGTVANSHCHSKDRRRNVK